MIKNVFLVSLGVLFGSVITSIMALGLFLHVCNHCPCLISNK